MLYTCLFVSQLCLLFLVRVCLCLSLSQDACPVPVYLLSCVRTFATVARQAARSLGFSRQGYWSGLPVPSPGDLPNPGTEPECPALAGRFFTTAPPGKLK